MIQVWDLAGDEKYRRVTEAYYVKTHVYLLVFDQNDWNSFDSISSYLSWIDQLKTWDSVIMLIGNKSDIIPNEISNEEIS